MDSLEQIRHRLTIASDLSSVVRTMKTLAAINVTQYEKLVATLADYERVIAAGFRVLANHDQRILRQDSEEGDLALIVFGSNQGLCGNFNRHITSSALELLDRKRHVKIAAVGRRVVEQLGRADHDAFAVFSLPSSLEGIHACLRQPLCAIDSWLTDSGISKVTLVYHHMIDHARYEPVVMPLVPMSLEWLAHSEAEPWATNQLPTLFQEPAALRSHLVQQYIYVSLFRAFGETLRSENAARMAAMQHAEKNIDEKQHQLSLEYHRQRQEAITCELIDVVAGAEMLKSDNLPRNL